MMITDKPDTKTTDRLVITELFNAFVAFLFAASAPVAIILSVALGGGLDEAELSATNGLFMDNSRRYFSGVGSSKSVIS
jgi:predicted benzoate:H+ symporter BenE